MKLEKIITQANENVRLEFTAMERSLRATGCTLPLLVIPYDTNRFELPAGAEWWADDELDAWLRRFNTHPGYRKYQCLLTGNYQFVDTDVCFLRNPGEVLAPHSGFITCCGHWRNTDHAVTSGSKEIMGAASTNWQRDVFNAGQFAADRALFTRETLRAAAEDPKHRETCLLVPYHEQAGLNLLRFLSGAPVTNLTLPPQNLESSWAGDYPGNYREFWTDELRKPYLIHWAGGIAAKRPPINELFLSFLTNEERKEWNERQAAKDADKRGAPRRLRHVLRRVKRAARVLRDG